MELPELGKRCFVSTCSQLDFLPVKCTHCSESFCKDHSSPFNHECPNLPDNPGQFVGPTESKNFPCSFKGCLERESMELLCTVCAQHFCISHRHHGCNEARRAAQRARREKFEAPKRQFRQAKEVVDKIIDAKIEKQRSLSGVKKDTANKVQLMRLKQKASGRRNVPISSRAYFLIHWVPQGATDPDTKAVFVNKEWALGRCVDEIADQCRIFPDNNPSTPKLRLFHMNGEILTEDMSLLLQKFLDDDTIIDGASLIMDFHIPSESGESETSSQLSIQTTDKLLLSPAP